MPASLPNACPGTVSGRPTWRHGSSSCISLQPLRTRKRKPVWTGSSSSSNVRTLRASAGPASRIGLMRHLDDDDLLEIATILERMEQRIMAAIDDLNTAVVN